jgi:hypothetical protein
VAINERNLEALKKGIEKQAVPYANYKMIANPDLESAKAMYAESLLKSYRRDALLDKTAMKKDAMRQMFFFNMAGAELPEVKEGDPNKKEMILKGREELLQKFESIPMATRQNILGQYKKKAKEVEEVMALFNKLGLKVKDQKTKQYKTIDWNNVLYGIGWYQEYQYFYKNYMGFRTQVDNQSLKNK